MPSTIVRRYILSLACLPAVAVPVPSYAGPIPTGSGPEWASLAPVPTVGGPGVGGVEGMSVALLGDKIVAALGYDNSIPGDTATTRIYSIASNTWLPNGANAPGASSEGAGTSHANLFYNLGGLTAGPGSPARADLWSYDLVSNAWTVLASMSQARAGLGVAVVGDSIYAIGGRTGTAAAPLAVSGTISPMQILGDVFFQADGTWLITHSEILTFTGTMSGLAIDTLSIVVDPYTGNGTVTGDFAFSGTIGTLTGTATLHVTGTVTNWSLSGNWNITAAAGGLAGSTGTGAWMLGWGAFGSYTGSVTLSSSPSSSTGPCSGGELSSVERYDVDTNTWSTVASLPGARSDLAAATVGGKIYVFGGCTSNPSTFLDDVDVYDPETDTWSTAPANMPTPRAGMYAVARKGGTVYVIGGEVGLAPGLSTNESYKVSTDTWTTGLLPMPTPRAEAGAVGTGGGIYILGGSQPAGGLSTSANEVFKP